MPNQQENSNDKNFKNTAMQSKNEFGKTTQGYSAKQDSQGQGGDAQSGGQLDQLVSFIKTNWKSVLSELVAAGVTAYLAHGAKDKTSKAN